MKKLYVSNISASLRLTSLITAILLLVSPLYSCAKDASQASLTTEEETQQAVSKEAQDDGVRTYIDPELPERDYNGYEFKIMNVDQANYGWLLTTVDADEENGETINDAVYQRNRIVEDKFNISINEIISQNSASVKTDLEKAVKAGLDVCDIALTGAENALVLAGEGVCFNIAEIPYIDLNKAYWD